MQVTGALPRVATGNFATASLPSDAKLLELIAQGDDRAIRTLFARHRVRIYRFALRLVGNEATAEDLVADVFFEVWRRAGQFQGNSQVSTWLLAITRNMALSVLRRRSTEELDESAAERIEDSADRPDTAMQKAEQSAIIGRCLKRLSPAHREIIDLVYYHEKSVDEVAKIIGIPQSTVKTRMFYARAQIAKLLQHAGIEHARH
jgi:RNA polymerase sigma-70 factor (ECF subfamily)